MVSWSTVTHTGDGVTELIHLRALAHLVTVQSKRTWLTHCNKKTLSLMCCQRHFTVNVKRSVDNHSLRSQPLPVKPGWQPHSPVTWLQEVARGQWHRWAHRFPYEPGKQTERAQMSYGGSVSRGQLTDIGENYFSRSATLSSLPDTCRSQWCDDMGRYDHTCNAPYSLAHINLENMLIKTHRMGINVHVIFLIVIFFSQHYDKITVWCFFTRLTACAHPACWTGTLATLSVTHATILTLAFVLTLHAEVSQSTFWKHKTHK